MENPKKFTKMFFFKCPKFVQVEKLGDNLKKQKLNFFWKSQKKISKIKERKNNGEKINLNIEDKI